MREALRALRSGIMRLLAPDVSGSISVSTEDIALCGGDDGGVNEINTNNRRKEQRNSMQT